MNHIKSSESDRERQFRLISILKKLKSWQDYHASKLEALTAYRNLDLNDRNKVEMPPDPPYDKELMSDVYKFLDQELRGIVSKLPGMMGPKANDPNFEISAGFTNVFHQAFVLILDKYPDKLLRAESRHQLTGYVSRTMSRMMINHYIQKRLHRKLTEKHYVDLSVLVEEKADYFKQSVGIGFEKGLKLMESWAESDDPELQRRAKALQLRYAYGLPKNDVAERMGLMRGELNLLLERAKYHMRKECDYGS